MKTENELKQFIYKYQLENGLNYKVQVFDLTIRNIKRILIDICSKDPKFDGMQIFYENGFYEVSEMVYNSHINIFCETKSFKIALKHLFLGNKQKIKKVIQSN